MATTSLKPLTGAGLSTGELARGAWPSSAPPSPHAHTRPSLVSARLWVAPAAIAVTSVSRGPGVGIERDTSVLSPSSPTPLSPQAQTLPSLSSARLKPLPAATATAPERPGTCVGVAQGCTTRPQPTAGCV